MRHRRLAVLVGTFVAVALLVGCGGSGGGGGGGTVDTSLGGSGGVLAEVESDDFVFDMKGGTGNTGSGGDGGSLWVETFGTDGIVAGTAGTIDTRFDYPADPTLFLGTEQLVVDGSLTQIVGATLTIDVYQDAVSGRDAVAVGEYFMVLSSVDQNIHKKTGAGTDVTVVGVHVKPGFTLVLGLNADSGGGTGLDYTDVSISDDVKIEGTLKVMDLTAGNPDGGALVPDVRHGDASASSADIGGLQFHCTNLVVTGTGRIDLSGYDAGASDTRGGDGGWIDADCDAVFLHGSVDCTGGNGLGTEEGGDGAVQSGGGAYRVYFWSDKQIVNTGPIDASGGNGGNDSYGGDAGYVDLEASMTVYNTATLRSSGGAGSTEYGGGGYQVYFLSEHGSICNSGKLETNGGASTGGTGGGAGNVYVYAGDSVGVGRVLNSGDIEARGGSSTNGDGGGGGYMCVKTYGADFVSVGTIDMRGGNGSNTGGTGGDANGMDIYTCQGQTYVIGIDVPPGDIIISGNVYLGGGNGDDGGTGGNAYFFGASDGGAEGFDELSADYFPITTGVFAYGYGSFDSSGGNGADGGYGNCIEFTTWVNTVRTDMVYIAAGQITVEADCDMSGGNGTGGAGGDAMYFTAYVDYNVDLAADLDASITIVGDITVEGGDGTAGGGCGVESTGIYIYNYGGIDITGDISCAGGDGIGTDADGGDAEDGGGEGINIASGFRDVIITGNVDISGGDGTGTGSGGGATYADIFAFGVVRVSGSIDASGGDVPGSAAGSQGGDGGDVTLLSQFGSSVGGTVDVSGGTAETGGNEGTYDLDGGGP